MLYTSIYYINLYIYIHTDDWRQRSDHFPFSAIGFCVFPWKLFFQVAIVRCTCRRKRFRVVLRRERWLPGLVDNINHGWVFFFMEKKTTESPINGGFNGKEWEHKLPWLPQGRCFGHLLSYFACQVAAGLLSAVRAYVPWTKQHWWQKISWATKCCFHMFSKVAAKL